MILLLLIITTLVEGGVYEYPVGIQDNRVFWILQTPERQLRLAIHDLDSNRFGLEKYSFNQEMLHCYSVGQFQLLPDGAGYSFIDSGRLRVKYYHKRSPISVDFIEPIYDVHTVIWLSKTQGIVSAKWHNHYGLFLFTLEGLTEPLVWSGKADFLFPQSDGNTLYCIEQSKKYGTPHYRIVSTMLANRHIIDWHDLSFEQKVSILLHHNEQEEYQILAAPLQELVNSKIAIGFLHMQHNTQGYYCSYERNKALIACTYHRLYKDDTLWKTEALFTFTIPIGLMNDLVERLMPCMPQVYDDQIYYCNAKQNTETVGLCSYDIGTGQTSEIIWQPGSIYLSCQRIGQSLYYGTGQIPR